jgi:hypothetical protein
MRRVALTSDQVEAYRLPPAPGKETDSRAEGFRARYGRLVQVELEALAPNDLRALFAEAIDELVEPELVERERERQKAERAGLVELAASWGAN